MNKEINVLSMFRNKNKTSYFAIHQFVETVKSVDKTVAVNFHIIWDDNQELGGSDDQYKNLIDSQFGSCITSYDRTFLKQYAKQAYKISDEQIIPFDNFYLIYRVLLGHYLRRVKMVDYFVILDDDIIINGDVSEVIQHILNKRPVLISEPMNMNCDKALFNSISQLYDARTFGEIYTARNPKYQGCNAGFQGVEASIFDDFLAPGYFLHLLSLFDYTSTKNPDGTEFFGPKRFLLDTQEQSFFSLLNICRSVATPIILPDSEYFVIPNWGTHPVFGEIDYKDENEGWTFALRSKIIHFIGHTQGKGKPKQFLDRVDAYLKRVI
jgi:hypothetical protein